ncbi:MAG: response regulator transcription factor [Elusimicrobiota bacterium]|jgi:two-component system phosphate regulon response regulator PhoB/two-component system alkaline phosphatase synthesis response regulator PhoP|nr:response regulator transcription factor [Elusimicrobiota bacterium]
MKLIYAVDDEKDILELLKVFLKKNFFKIQTFDNSFSFLKALSKKKPDLAIIDIMMPELDGFEIAKKIRADILLSDIGIIFLTAKSQKSDIIAGLEIGADDYIAKPFSLDELLARIKAVLRRKTQIKELPANFAKTEKIKLDRESFTVFTHGKKIYLTLTEFKILELLISNKNKVFSRDKLLDFLWGQDKDIIDRTIDVHIKNLRQKLGDCAVFIKNIRGIGYKFEE